jgi:hypothetical protein
VSTQENVFVGTASSVVAEAAFLAELLDLESIPDSRGAADDEIGLRGRARTAEGWLGFEVQPNNHVPAEAEPDEVQAIDAYPIEIDIWYGAKEQQVQRREARLVFDRLVEARPEVPALLCHELTFLIAAYLPGAGVHEFDPQTTMDAPDADSWRPWVSR